MPQRAQASWLFSLLLSACKRSSLFAKRTSNAGYTHEHQAVLFNFCKCWTPLDSGFFPRFTKARAGVNHDDAEAGDLEFWVFRPRHIQQRADAQGHDGHENDEGELTVFYGELCYFHFFWMARWLDGYMGFGETRTTTKKWSETQRPRQVLLRGTS